MKETEAFKLSFQESVFKGLFTKVFRESQQCLGNPADGGAVPLG